jgi:hypothetical protein
MPFCSTPTPVQSVEQKVIRRGLLSGDAEAGSGQRGARLHVMRGCTQKSKRQEIAVIQRQSSELATGDDRTH